MTRIRLDKKSAVPLYRQVSEKIKEMIKSGTLTPGSRIPSETELMDIFDVSRNTVRQAVSELISSGYLYVERGKGTFISKNIFDHPVERLSGFTEEMKSLGFDAKSKILTLAVENASKEVCNNLNVPLGSPVYHLKRVRFSNKIPIAIEEAFIPYDSFKGLLDNFTEESSLYRAFYEKFGIKPFYAEELIEASLTNKDESESLGVKKNFPVFRIERRTFDVKGNIIEFVKSVYRGDFYRLRLHLRRF